MRKVKSNRLWTNKRGDLNKYFFYSFLKPSEIASLTFPDDSSLPAKRGKFLPVLFITINVSFKLILPELFSAFRIVGILAVFMTMPETAMNKYNSPALWKDYIGFARKIFPVKSETKTHFVKLGTNN